MIAFYRYLIREESFCFVLDSLGLLVSAALCLKVASFLDESKFRTGILLFSFLFLGVLLLIINRFWMRSKFFSLENISYNASIALASQILMLPLLEMYGCSNMFWFFMTGFFFNTLFFLFSQAMINLCSSSNDES